VRRRRVEERGWAGDARVVDVKARACHGQKEEEDSREREERNGRCVVGVALLIDAVLFRACGTALWSPEEAPCSSGYSSVVVDARG
jgi:hypothetical protein